MLLSTVLADFNNNLLPADMYCQKMHTAPIEREDLYKPPSNQNCSDECFYVDPMMENAFDNYPFYMMGQHFGVYRPSESRFNGQFSPNECNVMRNCFNQFYHSEPILLNNGYFDESTYNNGPRNQKEKSIGVIRSALDRSNSERSYLRRRKLKSFMVRDLIDLPPEESQSDVGESINEFLTNSSMPIQQSTAYGRCDPLSLPESFNIPAENRTDLVSPDSTRPSVYNFEQLYKDSFKSGDGDLCNSVPSSPSSEALSDNHFGDSIQTSNGKGKRIRTIFNSEQLDRLEVEFSRTHYMVGPERSQLASELKLSDSQVKVWFQNRRIKHRKQFQEKQKAYLSQLKEPQPPKDPENNDSDQDNSQSSLRNEESACSQSSMRNE